MATDNQIQDWYNTYAMIAIKEHMGMKKKNGELVLTKVQKMVMEVFEMVGFAGLLKFE